MSSINLMENKSKTMQTTENRSIVHMDMDSFFVSVERLRNPALMNRPVIVGGYSQRGVVSACSYEVRKFGVRSGMSVMQARQLCPEALVLRGDMDAYIAKSEEITQIIADKAPLFEKASIDEHYLDITGMDRFHGSAMWTSELRDYLIKESGLPISCGLSVNKTVSKMVTGRAKPNGLLQIPAPEVQPFLDPMPVQAIPGLGEKTAMRLQLMGITRIGILRAMPPAVLENIFGKNGRLIWDKANGIDNTPIEPFSIRKSVGREETYHTDTADFRFLDTRLMAMAEEVGAELRNKNKLASCVTVKVRYSDFQTHTRQMAVPYTCADHDILAAARSLFKQVFNRRIMVRLLGVRVSHLAQGNQQLSLFENDVPMHKLYTAMDKIRLKYGDDAITRARTLNSLPSKILTEPVPLKSPNLTTRDFNKNYYGR